MKRYLLDTCVLIWLLENNERVADISYDIEYNQGDFAISVESIKEYIYKVQSGKLKTDVTVYELLDVLKKKGISIYSFDKDAIDALDKLPFYKCHPDPNDRNIIAHAIAEKRILITADLKFSKYKDLKLLKI